MSKTFVLSFLTTLMLSGYFGHWAGAAQQPCESLAKLALPDTKITLAQSVPAGAFIPPPSPFPMPGTPPNYKDLPAFCRIVAELAPTADSDIKIEVWMPASGWNGKYRGQGNGGFAGIIDYAGMAAAMRRGYATAGTDTGHTGFDAAWALGHPAKVNDFGYRGIHEMTLKGKAIMHAFYGDSPRHSYFSSCSDGGREALMEAQRFPEDYDGILAGAPANFWTRLLLGGMWTEEALTVDPAGYIPAAKLPALSATVLAACDAQDGLADGILDDPRQCHFDPATLVCREADSNSCLTPPQADALKKIYAGPHDSAGHQLFPGYLPGGELGPGGWALWITGQAPGRSLMSFFGVGYFSQMVYEKADWDYKTFDVEQALKIAEAKTAHALNATDPDLKSFQTRGGKLIMYHGWADAAIPATNSVNYYVSVVTAMGQPGTDSFLRLFMAPGMQHCADGPGPNSFGQPGSAAPDDPDHNAYIALERWVEKGVAPARIIATKYVDDSNPAKGAKMTRPLCPYPQVAKYKGSGDTNDAVNFVCASGLR
jgi:hypothetical protein